MISEMGRHLSDSSAPGQFPWRHQSGVGEDLPLEIFQVDVWEEYRPQPEGNNPDSHIEDGRDEEKEVAGSGCDEVEVALGILVGQGYRIITGFVEAVQQRQCLLGSVPLHSVEDVLYRLEGCPQKLPLKFHNSSWEANKQTVE